MDRSRMVHAHPTNQVGGEKDRKMQEMSLDEIDEDVTN